MRAAGSIATAQTSCLHRSWTKDHTIIWLLLSFNSSAENTFFYMNEKPSIRPCEHVDMWDLNRPLPETLKSCLGVYEGRKGVCKRWNNWIRVSLSFFESTNFRALITSGWCGPCARRPMRQDRRWDGLWSALCRRGKRRGFLLSPLSKVLNF